MTIAFLITGTLVMGVIFVNGWTDAPNAIATAISTRSMSPRSAIFMAVVMNFFGALVMTLISPQVAETISNMVSFGSDGNEAQIALAAALFSIVVWAVGAWFFGIPTSESHALIAGLTGSALAMGGIGAVNMAEWGKVLIGLLVSSTLGFGLGYGISKLIQVTFRSLRNRRKLDNAFKKAQIGGAAAMAFMHGAQDGQKFMGVFMLTLFYNGMASKVDGGFVIPLWMMVLCSVVMGLGTSIGGMRIIKAVGLDMVKMEKYQGFSADLGAALCLLGSSLFGIPLSTTHTKTTSIMGVGASRRFSSVDWRIVKDMSLAWILTFPGCGLIAFLITKLFIYIF